MWEYWNDLSIWSQIFLIVIGGGSIVGVIYSLIFFIPAGNETEYDDKDKTG